MAQMKMDERLRQKIINSIFGVHTIDGDVAHCKYDTIKIDLERNRVEFRYLGEAMFYLDLPNGMRNGESLTIEGLDGRVKMTLNV